MGDKKDVFGSFYFGLNCRVLNLVAYFAECIEYTELFRGNSVHKHYRVFSAIAAPFHLGQISKFRISPLLPYSKYRLQNFQDYNHTRSPRRNI